MTDTKMQRGLLAAAVLVLALPPLAEAQQQRQSIERNRAAMCAKADFDRDSYRPFVCDPRCDCLDSDANLTSCVESSPGVFDVLGTEPESGSCLPANQDCTDTGLGYSVCLGSDDPTFGQPCSGGCGPGLTCLPPDDFCGILCTTVADCPVVQLQLCATARSCTTAQDCDPVEFCHGFGVCSASCTADSDCDRVLPFSLTLSGVTTADAPQSVNCDGTSINSNDALECIEQIQLAIGQTCTPAP